ncbi:MAG: peptidylprolyl isomerase [Chitinophagales bacterium]
MISRLIAVFSIVFLFCCMAFLSACSLFGSSDASNENEPIARVFNQFLYRSDLEKMLGDNYTSEDSVNLSNYYMYDWIHHNLLLKKAELELPNSKDEIEQKIADYRASLLLFLYEQNLLQKNMDTVITESDISNYYQEHQESFLLRDPILKVQFVILKKESPQLDSVRYWLKSGSEMAMKSLQTYCFQYAINFSLSPTWHTLEQFSQEIPISEEEVDELLSDASLFETRDAVNIYFVKIEDYGLQGKLAPLDYKKGEITKMMVNKRRIEHIKEMKDEIYKDALEKNQYEVFD